MRPRAAAFDPRASGLEVTSHTATSSRFVFRSRSSEAVTDPCHQLLSLGFSIGRLVLTEYGLSNISSVLKPAMEYFSRSHGSTRYCEEAHQLVGQDLHIHLRCGELIRGVLGSGERTDFAIRPRDHHTKHGYEERSWLMHTDNTSCSRSPFVPSRVWTRLGGQIWSGANGPLLSGRSPTPPSGTGSRRFPVPEEWSGAKRLQICRYHPSGTLVDQRPSRVAMDMVHPGPGTAPGVANQRRGGGRGRRDARIREGSSSPPRTKPLSAGPVISSRVPWI